MNIEIKVIFTISILIIFYFLYNYKDKIKIYIAKNKDLSSSSNENLKEKQKKLNEDNINNIKCDEDEFFEVEEDENIINNEISSSINKKNKNKFKNNKNLVPSINIKNISTETNIFPEEEEFIKRYGYIKWKIKHTPKIGLNNVGCTCYMNSTLQCLSATEKLTNFFLDPENRDRINYNNKIMLGKKEQNLCIPYYEVLQNLWRENSNIKSYSPENFKKAISKINKIFEGNNASDSKELLRTILESLHQELNSVYDGPRESEGMNQVNPYNRLFTFNLFINSIFQKNKSIISDLFYGIQEIRSECNQCRMKAYQQRNPNSITKYNFQIFNFIIFPLEETRVFKNILYNLNNSNNIVDIYDCFENYRKTTQMTGDNMLWCNKCRNMTISDYVTMLYNVPEILILILDRGKGNIYDVKLVFYETINIGKYVITANNGNLNYSLYGVVTHMGSSSASGHFISYCKSPIDEKWYKYNDSFVSEVKNFKSEILDYACPYILFYKKI